MIIFLKKCFLKLKHLKVTNYIIKNEKTFVKDGKTIKYLYIPSEDSKSLAVIFSAFPGPNKVAGYNMVSTFMNIKINKLFILDDFGYKKRGAYYLSENGEYFIPPLVNELLKKHMDGMDKVCFLGSSKGGAAALYYGLKTEGVDLILSGAPQYYIGDYLVCKPEHYPILDAMAGSHSDTAVNEYNRILPTAVNECKLNTKPKILIHYSKSEPTYEHHIKSLVDDLIKNKFEIIEDIEEYELHSDVAKYFPNLCKKHLKNMEE